MMNALLQKHASRQLLVPIYHQYRMFGVIADAMHAKLKTKFSPDQLTVRDLIGDESKLEASALIVYAYIDCDSH